MRTRNRTKFKFHLKFTNGVELESNIKARNKRLAVRNFWFHSSQFVNDEGEYTIKTYIRK